MPSGTLRSQEGYWSGYQPLTRRLELVQRQALRLQRLTIQAPQTQSEFYISVAVFLAAQEPRVLTDLQQPTLTGELAAAAAALVMQSPIFLGARAQRASVKTGQTHLADQRQPHHKQELLLDMVAAAVVLAEHQLQVLLALWAAEVEVVAEHTRLALHLVPAALAGLAMFLSFQFR